MPQVCSPCTKVTLTQSIILTGMLKKASSAVMKVVIKLDHYQANVAERIPQT